MRESRALGVLGVLLTAIFAGLAAAGPEEPQGCPPEAYYTQATGGAERYDGSSIVYFDVVVRRYSQVTATCAYRQWIETIGGHSTEAEYTVFQPVYAITSFVIVRNAGSISWAALTFTKHDTETYQVASGCAPGGLSYCNLYHKGMGSPIPGNLHHYYKTNNLPSAYWGQPVTVEINANLYPLNWPAPVVLTLPSPP